MFNSCQSVQQYFYDCLGFFLVLANYLYEKLKLLFSFVNLL